MKQTKTLKNHFLIATPKLQDVNFSKAVIYLYEHSKDGAMGIVINKPLQVTLGSILQHLDITTSSKPVKNKAVLMGGPVGPEQGLVTHKVVDSKNKSEKIIISGSKETLKAIAQGRGPECFIITLGYSGWQSGQLEQEIGRDDWLIAPFESSIIFETPIEKRWQKAAKLLGIDINQLSGQIGHA